jgi:hypothetical protein
VTCVVNYSRRDYWPNLNVCFRVCSAKQRLVMNIEFVANKRRGQNLHLEGFRYKKNKTTNSRVSFKCAVASCNCRVILNANLDRVIQQPGQHNHSEDDVILSEELRQHMMDAIESNPTKTPSHLRRNSRTFSGRLCPSVFVS